MQSSVVLYIVNPCTVCMCFRYAQYTLFIYIHILYVHMYIHIPHSPQTCIVVSSTQLSCVIPQLSNVNASRSFQYSLIFDNELLTPAQPLTSVADPVFSGSEPTEYQDNSGQPLTLSVSRCGVLYYDSDLWQHYQVHASVNHCINVHTYIHTILQSAYFLIVYIYVQYRCICGMYWVLVVAQAYILPYRY